jgi:MoaA/NifB/PqqE/SkfB family radical SAM enzyme
MTGLMNSQLPKYPRVLSGPISTLVASLISLQYILLALWQYRSVKTAREVLSSIGKLAKDFLGDSQYNRIVFTGRKFYFNLHAPGFPSKIILKNNLAELHKIKPIRAPHNRLRILFQSITNKCPLKCEHCYEWPNLNKPDLLGAEEYKRILSKFTAAGIGQVHLGGGEAMLRYPCLLDLTKFLKSKTEVWLATSGLGVTFEKALELKNNGMTGMVISVDHYHEEKHNIFRGSERSFDWAMNATENSIRAGLITCWSICVTREFVTQENLDRYVSFAASKGIHFIQVFEPMVTERFRDPEVMLTREQFDILEDYYITINSQKKMKKTPLVTYHGYHQRRIGCKGKGESYLFIDSSGQMHACPYCRNDRQISALDYPLETSLERLSEEKCVLEQA